MAWFLLARLLFTGAVAYTAFLLRPVGPDPLTNVVFGLGLAGVAVIFEWLLRDLALTNLLGALLGGAIGVALAVAVGAALFWTNHQDQRVAFLHGFLLLLLPYLGLVIGGRKGEWLEPARLVGLFRASGPQRRYKILDTSVIIDGRIADLCDTGFIDGTLVIPQFVLKELQLVADSADSMKRNRGRRGLDILQKIQKMSGVEVSISDMDYPEVREVDLKLIELARTLQGKIVTNDFNLNKVAQLRGVDVLNINELANALKPVVLPGEIMKVFILKEGKEYNQGVAYLDDGTMVVVDNARKMISKTIDIVVTSVLQTTAGKMIFGRYIDSTLSSQSGQNSSSSMAAEDSRRTPRQIAPAQAASPHGPVTPIVAAAPNSGK
ncbi:MAG TPA: PIN domain-containing protein [Vicinamibacterales bacterium]|nr:PIN domain-containing protein [Vicinamibacterales bacterium]